MQRIQIFKMFMLYFNLGGRISYRNEKLINVKKKKKSGVGCLKNLLVEGKKLRTATTQFN